MNERDFLKMLARIEDKFGEQGNYFVGIVENMMEMLDEADQDDYYGTEGYRHHLGWD